MDKTSEIRDAARGFIVNAVYGGQDDASLKNDTPLLSSRLVDSIIALKLVSYLETTFGIEFEAHEVDQENLDTLDRIAAFVQSKLK